VPGHDAIACDEEYQQNWHDGEPICRIDADDAVDEKFESAIRSLKSGPIRNDHDESTDCEEDVDADPAKLIEDAQDRLGKDVDAVSGELHVHEHDERGRDRTKTLNVPEDATCVRHALVRFALPEPEISIRLNHFCRTILPCFRA
jgi:hypothetical protein